MREITPTETYLLRGREVHVKRDDLMGDNIEYPAWGKLTGIRNVLRSKVSKKRPLVHLGVFGSFSGWALAKLCAEEDIEFIMAYPDSKTFPEMMIEKVKEAGSDVLPMKPNMMSFMSNKLGSIAKEKGYQRLPYAFDCIEYHNTLAQRYRDVVKEHGEFDILVVSAGAGVTCIGLIKEHSPGPNLFDNQRKMFYTVYMSTDTTISKKFNSEGFSICNEIVINESKYDFNDPMEWYEVPFPCNEHWDKKCWHWLDENIENIPEGRILFWNLGGHILWDTK